MDRNVLDVIEREIDEEVRTRFPGAAVRQVVLLQHGDDPQIEPRDLWVRVILDSDGPDDDERAWKEFAGPRQAAIEELPRSLAEKVREIMNVEFRFSDRTGARSVCDGPQYGYPAGRRLSDYQEWERGAATFVRAPMGPAGLETVDTLIMAGIADTRTEAIRWAVDRFRELPDYERLRDQVRDADNLKDGFPAGGGSPRGAGTDRDALDAIEREIDEEAKLRFPGGAVSRVLLLQYGDDPEVEPGDLWVRVIPAADGPEEWQPTLDAFGDAHEAGIDQFVSYLAEKLCQIRIVEFTFNVPVTRDGHCPRMSRGVAQKLSDYRRERLGDDIFELARLGPAGLETVDTLIMAGIADTRGDAIRTALDCIRELPAYERLRAHLLDTRSLIDEFSAEGECGGRLMRPLRASPGASRCDTGPMVDDTARDRAIYHALKAADEVAAALQTHLIEEHGADPERAAPQSSSSNSLKLLRQAREHLGEGLRAVEADHIAESDGISLRSR